MFFIPSDATEIFLAGTQLPDKSSSKSNFNNYEHPSDIFKHIFFFDNTELYLWNGNYELFRRYGH